MECDERWRYRVDNKEVLLTRFLTSSDANSGPRRRRDKASLTGARRLT
jgi:hypothetical protein